MSDLLKNLSMRISVDPVLEKPNEIYEQVRPLATKMGLNVMVDRTKTSIIEGQIQGKNSLYNLTLRRNAQLTADTIDRIKRNEAYLNVIQWSAKAIEIQLWWPYQAPAAVTPAAPARPGVPPVAPGAPPAPPK